MKAMAMVKRGEKGIHAKTDTNQTNVVMEIKLILMQFCGKNNS